MKRKLRYLRSGVRERVENRRVLAKKESYDVGDLCEQNPTVRLDDAQLNELMGELTQRIEWSTNRIVDESKPSQMPIQISSKHSGSFSYLLKCIIGLPIMLFGVSILVFLIQSAKVYWGQGGNMQLMIIFLGIAAFDCFCLGIEIFREKDRNYIVALFSALVSLVALLVTLIN